MPKFGGPRPYGFRQKYVERFPIFLSFVTMAIRVFEEIKFFQGILIRTMAGSFL